MRRAALSITSNIAEGFGRVHSKDREHFYVMAYGSLIELENQYQAAVDLEFLSQNGFQAALDLIVIEGRMLNKFISTHRERSSL